MNRKKIIIITIVVLVIILVILVVFNIFFKSSRPSSEFVSSLRSPEEFLTDSISPQTEERLIRLTQGPIAAFRPVDNGLLVVSSEGLVQEIDEEGGLKKEIINLSLENVLRSQISPDGSVAFLTTTGADQKERWVLFNSETQKLKALATGTSWVSFSPQGKMLSVIIGGDVSLIIVTEDANEKTVLTTKIPDLIASWLNEDTILLTTKPSGLAPGIVYFLDAKSGRVERMLDSRRGLTALGSVDEQRIVYSETDSNGKNISLRLLDPAREKSNLTVASLPEKCTFSQDSRFLFCSLFNTSANTYLMPDDYYKDVFTNNSSDFVKINLENGQTQLLAENLLVDGVDLQLSKDERWLFFINKKDGVLYRLKLQ